MSRQVNLRNQILQVISLIFFLAQPAHAAEFSNSALDREISNPTNSESFISELKSIYNRCSINTNLKKITVPLDHSQPAKSISYFYEYRRASSPTSQTIIYLPGGPGVAAIGAVFLPSTMNQIQIDPRGVGCNFGDAKDFPLSTMTTEQAISDVIDIIRQEKLTNYIIFGHSYGTVSATMLAASIGSFGLPQPKAVVLAGVVGKPSTSWMDYIRPLSTRLNLEVPQDVKSRLRDLTQSPEQSVFIGWVFENSYDDDKAGWVIQFQEKLLSASSEIKNASDLFKEQYGYFEKARQASAPISPADFVTDTITCGEQYLTFELQKYGVVFINGHFDVGIFRGDAPDRCKPMVRHPYDPASFQIAAPIYYFQGDRDVATPLEAAVYHYSSQTRAPYKVFNKLHGKGHDSFRLNLGTCMESIFDSAFRNERNMEYIFDANGNCR